MFCLKNNGDIVTCLHTKWTNLGVHVLWLHTGKQVLTITNCNSVLPAAHWWVTKLYKLFLRFLSAHVFKVQQLLCLLCCAISGIILVCGGFGSSFPDLDCPISTAGYVDIRMEWVPTNLFNDKICWYFRSQPQFDRQCILPLLMIWWNHVV